MSTYASDTEKRARYFAGLCEQLNVQPDRKGEAWIACPWCSKDDGHFSFSERGYRCFKCGQKGKALSVVARQLNTGPVAERQPARQQKPAEPRRWQTDPRVLERYTGAYDTLPAWQGYKPLSLTTIARARLGVGVLPSSRCKARRLILPVFAHGELVALHGRAFLPGDEDAKWLTSGGSRKDVLYGADDLRPGCTVVVCENLVDSLLARQRRPDVVVVASGGVSWSEAFTQQLVAARPKHVLVWLDNDLAGAPNEPTYHALRAAWLRERPGTTPPEPKGPQIANDLLAAGIKASVYQWPAGTPPKMDLGAVLMQDERKAA